MKNRRDDGSLGREGDEAEENQEEVSAGHIRGKDAGTVRASSKKDERPILLLSKAVAERGNGKRGETRSQHGSKHDPQKMVVASKLVNNMDNPGNYRGRELVRGKMGGKENGIRKNGRRAANKEKNNEARG